MITSFAIIVVIFFVIQKRKQLQHLMKQQQMKYDFEHSLLSTRIEVQEQVLATVSLEIHDNIGQNLSLGCIQLANLRDSVSSVKEEEAIEGILQLFKQTIKDLRLLSHSLNTGLVEERALEHSIQTELDRVQAFSRIQCELKLNTDEAILPGGQKLITFRIIQEALQNILKHAEATRICIDISRKDQNIILSIEDNGVGFDMGKNGEVSSLGLLGMQQRASFLGAGLKINSWIGKGTTLILSIPINV